MRYSATQYAEAFYELLAGATVPTKRKDIVARFAATLEAHHATKLADDIIFHMEKIRQERENVVPVIVRTAGASHPEFPKHLGGKKIELTVIPDPTLIAGTIITVGDDRIDNSVRARLKELSDAIH